MDVDVREDRGIVCNIQRFSIHDGPGIRTTVFLKGCPLRCPWCSNPESQQDTPEVFLRAAKCIKCGRCQEACPAGAIAVAEAGAAIDRDRCTACLACAAACPSRALEATGEEMSAAEILDVVLRDRGFYRQSGGGVTLSGGEPLRQWPLVANLLRQAKGHGVHTAVDTAGHVDWEALAAVLPYTDLFLYDLKHADPVRHQAAIGVTNDIILENLRRLLGQPGAEVWIRVALIPGFNASLEDVAAMTEIIQGLPCPPAKISLLSFHKYAAGKYEALGRQYAAGDIGMLTEAEVARLKAAVEATGIPVTIGA
jgi:pyruvate formate lyase activating enzyme